MISFLNTLLYSLVLLFGVTISLLFAGVSRTRKDILFTSCFCAILLFTQLICWQTIGLTTTKRVYPFITHLPLILYLFFYYKRPWLVSISSVFAAYLCCQLPHWIGSTAEALFDSQLANDICNIASLVIVYYFLKKYVASSIQQLINRSTRSCLLFGTLPLLYYLFDYVTTIYSNLLYSGSKWAVQFMPSLACSFYLIFVLLYNKEMQNQANAQRERDIVASQLHQAQAELDSLRLMQKKTVIYRHDMRHHLSLIGCFAADGDLQKIKEYLAITNADIDAMTPIRYCNNETVNLILSSFETRAKKQGVVMCIDVTLPEVLSINDTELCTLLSNALENAIFAASQVKEEKLRKLYIHSIINGNKLLISTENAYVGEIMMDGEYPVSNNKLPGHGFGIKSMVSIVERYGGLYSFETEGGIFTLQLLIPLRKEID